MKRTLRFLVLGVSFLVLLAITVMLWQRSLKPLAYLLWMLATAFIIVLFVQLASHIRPNPISPKVLAALITALKDDDPSVRSKAVVGLTELDLEESAHSYKHDDLDNALITALEDSSSIVRSKAVEGLTELEVDQFTHHQHNQLEGALLKDMAQTFEQK